MNPDDDAHLHEIKHRIVQKNKEKAQKLAKRYNKNKRFDASRGQCCCRYRNDQGARAIQILDAINIVNLPRWIFAVWVLVDPQRVELYSRVRYITCYLIWVSIFASAISYSMIDLFDTKQAEEEEEAERSN